MSEEAYKKLLGSRILSEANDLKRTVEALSSDINVSIDKLKNIISGKSSIEDIYDVIKKMGAIYPIDSHELLLPKDDCENGVKIMRARDSEASGRIFDRKDGRGDATPYYEYRDTAMSKIAPFRPEWIRELRFVNNQDPNNPDVAYNNGHLLHQVTFFIGPVNFYWEINGKKFSKEMNTGDSNYITPYWPHSFTTRDKNRKAFILAVTFGGDVRRAARELYTLGERGIKGHVVDYRNNAKQIAQLIRQHVANEYMNLDILKAKIAKVSPDIKIDKFFDGKKDLSPKELFAIARALSVKVSDLMMPRYNFADEVVVKQRSDEDFYFYPDDFKRFYRIYPLARTTKMQLVKGFDLVVLKNSRDISYPFHNSLHWWIYNYSDTPAEITWILGDKEFNNILETHDSVYIQPFIPYAFSNKGHGTARLCSVGVGGSINLAAQRELSYFSSVDRVIEQQQWFD